MTIEYKSESVQSESLSLLTAYIEAQAFVNALGQLLPETCEQPPEVLPATVFFERRDDGSIKQMSLKKC